MAEISLSSNMYASEMNSSICIYGGCRITCVSELFCVQLMLYASGGRNMAIEC